ncbi:MAG TPA: hypothetical protein VF518_16215 [Polyangia bacterium]
MATAALLLALAVPLLGRTGLGDLSNHFGDHLAHTWATDIFYHRGLDIYRRPFGELWKDSTFPVREQAWGDMARPYPPGVFALFTPLVVLARTIAIPKPMLGMIAVIYLLVWTHLGFVSLFKLLARTPPGARLIAGVLLWAVLVHLALQGFYDPLWIGCGFAMAYALVEDRPASALRWFALAALLHFRAVTLAPLGLWALWRAIHKRPAATWPWATIGLCAIALVLVAVSFVLVYPNTGSRRAIAPPLAQLVKSGAFPMILVVTGAGVAAMLRFRDPVSALTMALVGLLAFVDLGVYRGYWHHASIATTVLVAVLAKIDERSSVRLQIAILWLMAIFPIVWLATPAALIIDMVNSFRPHL